MQSQRVEYIDTAKAVGILLMILGHCYYVGTVFKLGMWIYSFHMPLFFIISGMFIKPLAFKDGIVKYAKAYIKPYCMACVVMFVLTLFLNYITDDVRSTPFIALQRFAYGKESHEWIGHLHDFPEVGPIWFLLALFWGGQFYSIIKFSVKDIMCSFILCFFLFFIGYMSAKLVVLPFSLQPGLCSLPFLFVGDMLKNHADLNQVVSLKKRYIAIILVVWLCVILVMKDDLNMASCRYDEGAVRIPVSILATIITLQGCRCLNKKGIKLKWLGTNTLCILVGHQIFRYFCKEVGFDFSFLGETFPRPIPIITEFIIQVVVAVSLGVALKKVRIL